MRLRIHYTVSGVEDSFDLEGEDEIELEGEVKKEILWRGLDLGKNDCWTEIIT
jgi:hypothetical protein